MMTTGEVLKKELGLEKFRYVRIARALISAYKILFVWYDSFRPDIPITTVRVIKFPWSTMIWHGTDLLHGSSKVPVFTPIIDIEMYNGQLRGALIISVDLVGKNLIKPNVFSKKFRDNIQREVMSISYLLKIQYQGLNQLQEFLNIGDLMKNQGMSDFTKKHRKIRNKSIGAENITAKIIEVVIDQSENHVTFAFLTTATEPIYPPDYDFKNTKPDQNFTLVSDPSKTYTQQIRILEFFDWLDVFEGEEIKEKDIKDIMEVANVQVFSDDPSFHWQGMNYWISQLDGSINPTKIKPKFWNRKDLHGDGVAFLNKHLQGLINQFKFFYSPMASMLTKKLKDLNILPKKS